MSLLLFQWQELKAGNRTVFESLGKVAVSVAVVLQKMQRHIIKITVFIIIYTSKEKHFCR
jgi:hypothetical protein